jgi:hypothetical protein
MYDDKILATEGGTNTKLGGSISYTVGQTREQAKQSCKSTGCDFLSKDDGGNAGKFRITTGPNKGQIIDKKDTWVFLAACEEHDDIRKSKAGELVQRVPLCYSQYGTDSFSLSSKAKAHQRGKDYSLESALKNRRMGVKAVRGATIGDPSGLLTEQELSDLDARIRAEGLSHILYSHGWKVAPWVLRFACASANSWDEVAAAFRAGASVVTVTNPNLMGKGAKFVWGLEEIPIINCLEAEQGKTCEECLLCDAPARRLNQKTPRIIVVFPDHAPGSHKRKRAVRRRQVMKVLDISHPRFDDLKGSKKLIPELRKARSKTNNDRISLQIDRLIGWFR